MSSAEYDGRMASAQAEYDAWLAGQSHRKGRCPERRNHRVRQDTCRRGHAYTAENTYLSRTGHRTCRTCRNELARIRRTQHDDGRRTARRKLTVKLTKVRP